MNRAAVIETTCPSFGTGFATAGGRDVAWPALVAADLGAVDANYSADGMILAAEDNGYAACVRRMAALRTKNVVAGMPARSDAVLIHNGLLDAAATYKKNGAFYPGALDAAVRAVVAFARLSAFYGAEPAGASDSSIAYGGSWTDYASTTQCVGDGYRGTAQVGATATITVGADFQGGEIDLFWVATPGATASMSIAVSGATVRTASDAITARDTNQITAHSNYKATRLRGLNAGAHTITVTVTAAAGLGVGFDGWGVRAQVPPEVILCSQPFVSPAYYFIWAGVYSADILGDADVTRVNRHLEALAVDTGARWLELPQRLNVAAYTADGLHPSEATHRIWADCVLDLLDSLPEGARNPSLFGPAPDLAANWAVAGDPYSPLAIQRTRPRRVSLSGRAQRTGTPTVGETIATIPEGLRPAASRSYACPGSTGTPTVTVAADGTVKYAAGTLGAGATIDLDAVAWTVGR